MMIMMNDDDDNTVNVRLIMMLIRTVMSWPQTMRPHKTAVQLPLQQTGRATTLGNNAGWIPACDGRGKTKMNEQ